MPTLDEYGDRIDAALAARTRGELGAVVADLPLAPSRQRAAVLPGPVVEIVIGSWLRRLHGS